MEEEIVAVNAHSHSIYGESVSALLCIHKKIDDLKSIGLTLKTPTERLFKTLELLMRCNLIKLPELPGKFSLTQKGKNVVEYHVRESDYSGNSPFILISPRS
jgi:hypothetical protein